MLQENPLLEKADGEDESPPASSRARWTEHPYPIPMCEPNARTTPTRLPSAARPPTSARMRTASIARISRTIRPAIPTGAARAQRDDDDGFFPQQVAASSLRDHLLRQLAELSLPLRDRQIVASLIDALDDDGYLHTSLEEIAELFPEELDIDPDELSIALRYLQSFEPAGIGARDASECLTLQLKALPASTPLRAEALQLVAEHLPLLAARDFTKLKRLLHCDDVAVRSVRALIMSLSPRPGASFAKSEANYVIPDVVVRKYRGKWTTALNEPRCPSSG